MGIQFNATEAKSFRNTLAKYHVGMHKIANYANRRGDELSRTKESIEVARQDIEDIENGTYEYHSTREELEAKIATLEAQARKIEEDFEEASKKYQKSVDDAIKLVKNDEALYEAYAKCAKSQFADEDYQALNEALAKFFVDNGLKDATSDNVVRFTRAIGVKVNSNKQKYETKNLTGASGKTVYIKLLLGLIADIMAAEGIIAPAKYTYVPLSIRKKEEKAKKAEAKSANK